MNTTRIIYLLIILLISPATQAAVATVEFNGTIDRILWSSDPSIISVPLGTAFSGTFTLNTDNSTTTSQENGTLDSDTDYSYAYYRFVGAPYGFDVKIGSQNYSIQQTTIGIHDTTSQKPDKFIASTVDYPFTKNNPGGLFFTIVIDNNSSFYDGTDLPNTIPSSSSFKGFYVGARNSDGAVVYSARGDIDNLSITTVPVPFALPLFVSGLGLLLGISAKQYKLKQC